MDSHAPKRNVVSYEEDGFLQATTLSDMGYAECMGTYQRWSNTVLASAIELDGLADVRRLRSGAGFVQPFLDEDRKTPSVYCQL